jgi:hypothetical protein
MWMKSQTVLYTKFLKQSKFKILCGIPDSTKGSGANVLYCIIYGCVE